MKSLGVYFDFTLTKATWKLSVELRDDYALGLRLHGRVEGGGAIKEDTLAVKNEMVTGKGMTSGQMQDISGRNR